MDDEEFEYEVTRRRFRPLDIVVVGLGFLHGVTIAINEAAMNAYNLAAMHANYKAEQDDFREEAALAIESITSGEAEDGE